VTDDISSKASEGGKARAANLTGHRRAEIARQAAEARWGSTIQTATHVGELVIGDRLISCAVLTDGTRVLSQSTVLTVLGRNPDKSRSTRHGSEARAPFLSAQNLQPYISPELNELAAPIAYKEAGHPMRSWGYRAEMLPMVCEVYLEARENGRLTPNQQPVARMAEILIRALARIGILALVDEATGYQEVRARDELQRILEAYVQRELMPWVKRFPNEFFQEIYRLQGWEYKPGTSKRTPYVGRLVNKYVYEQLPPGVLEELRALNPKNASGRRAYKHHQFLTADTGNPHLDKQISTVTTLMRIARDKKDFEDMFDRAFSTQTRLPLVIDTD
jgi:hypothetical protein